MASTQPKIHINYYLPSPVGARLGDFMLKNCGLDSDFKPVGFG